MHPSLVLFDKTPMSLALPACDHYAGSEHLMRKSLARQQETGPLFDITFDCEDGAAAGRETAHAHMIAALIASEENHFGRIGVRVHDMHSDFFEPDCAIICKDPAQRLAYVVIPKTESATELKLAIETVNRHSGSYRGSCTGSVAHRPHLPIHVLIETHGALADVSEIAAIPQVECLSFGIMDFVSAHNGAIPGAAMRSPAQFTHPLIVRAKIEIAAACHRYGKVPSHNVTTEIRESRLVAEDAKRAAEQFGYRRMWSIHPDQIMPIVTAFSPQIGDIAEATDILTAAKAAQWGPIKFDGRLHDRASYRHYWTVLRRAKTSGLCLSPAATAFL